MSIAVKSCLFFVFACVGLFAQNFPQPTAAREYTITEIPGVVKAGAQWTLVWQGTDNADGIVPSKDGGLLFAQEQPSQITKLDRKGKASPFLKDTHGTGALAIDSKGRIFAAERTCTDPGRRPADCKEPTAIAELSPERKTLVDNIDGKSLGRLNDLMVSRAGNIYFNGAGTYFLNAAGKVVSIGPGLRTNGILLSRDEKTLYVTNRNELVAFEIDTDGSIKNQRNFAKLEGGGTGDGMAIDNDGRIYVSSQPGVQVFGADGKYLGVIATPRPVISVAFSGRDKKTMYVVGSGALGPDGKEFRTAAGVRNNAKTIYSIPVETAGFKGRAK